MSHNNFAFLYIIETIKNVVIHIMKQVIFFIHLMLYIAAILTPFFGSPVLLKMFSLIVPFLFLHWSLNDDTCALTVMEQSVTGYEKYETFTGQLMKGIYIMPDNDYGKLSKILFFVLWLITEFRLGRLDFVFSAFYLLRKQYR